MHWHCMQWQTKSTPILRSILWHEFINSSSKWTEATEVILKSNWDNFFKNRVCFYHCLALQCQPRAHCRRTEILQMSLKVIVCDCNTKSKEKRGTSGKIAWLALLFTSRAFCSILIYLSLQAWLVRWNKNVDTLFQQMRNDKCINHSSSVVLEISVWHSLRMFVGSLMKTCTRGSCAEKDEVVFKASNIYRDGSFHERVYLHWFHNAAQLYTFIHSHLLFISSLNTVWK